MDQYVANVIQTAFYSAGAAAGAIGVAYFWYKARKSDHETKPGRIKASQDLMNSEGYKKLMAERSELALKIYQERLRGRISPADYHPHLVVNAIVDEALGKLEKMV